MAPGIYHKTALLKRGGEGLEAGQRWKGGGSEQRACCKSIWGAFDKTLWTKRIWCFSNLQRCSYLIHNRTIIQYYRFLGARANNTLHASSVIATSRRRDRKKWGSEMLSFSLPAHPSIPPPPHGHHCSAIQLITSSCRRKCLYAMHFNALPACEPAGRRGVSTRLCVIHELLRCDWLSLSLIPLLCLQGSLRELCICISMHLSAKSKVHSEIFFAEYRITQRNAEFETRVLVTAS